MLETFGEFERKLHQAETALSHFRSKIRSELHSLSTGQLLGQTNWRIGDDDETGISLGDGLKFGGYKVELMLETVSRPKHSLALGGWAGELGAGAGARGKLKALGEAIEKIKELVGPAASIKSSKNPATGKSLPGGSIGPLRYGPNGRAPLDRAQFEQSNWIYISGGGTGVALEGDIGLIFLLSRPWISILTSAMREMPPLIGPMPGIMLAYMIISNTLAWAPLGGLMVSAGLEIGASAKVIHITEVKDGE